MCAILSKTRSELVLSSVQSIVFLFWGHGGFQDLFPRRINELVLDWAGENQGIGRDDADVTFTLVGDDDLHISSLEVEKRVMGFNVWYTSCWGALVGERRG